MPLRLCPAWRRAPRRRPRPGVAREASGLAWPRPWASRLWWRNGRWFARDARHTCGGGFWRRQLPRCAQSRRGEHASLPRSHPPRGRHRAQGARDLAARGARLLPSPLERGLARGGRDRRRGKRPPLRPTGLGDRPRARAHSQQPSSVRIHPPARPPGDLLADREGGAPGTPGGPGPGSPRRRTPPARDRGRHPRALALPLREPSRRAHARRTVRGRLRRSRSGWATRCLHRAQDAPRPLDRAH